MNDSNFTKKTTLKLWTLNRAIRVKISQSINAFTHLFAPKVGAKGLAARRRARDAAVALLIGLWVANGTERESGERRARPEAGPRRGPGRSAASRRRPRRERQPSGRRARVPQPRPSRHGTRGSALRGRPGLRRRLLEGPQKARGRGGGALVACADHDAVQRRDTVLPEAPPHHPHCVDLG